MRYYYPPKPYETNSESDYFKKLENDYNWIAELKKNGWRCLVYRDEELTLWTRYATIIKDKLPEVRERLMTLPLGTILDGELLFTRRIKGQPDGLYIFDIVQTHYELVVNRKLYQRKQLLDALMEDIKGGSIEVSEWHRKGKRQLYELACQMPDSEGIVLKHLESTYPISTKSCQDYPKWVKVKKVGNHVRL